MKILYIAKHDSGGNDDEGAIAHALAGLGNTVIKVTEDDANTLQKFPPADFCLFHKWDNLHQMTRIKCVKAFWYFDLVDWPDDPLLEGRCKRRVEWMQNVLPRVDYGFCTDGDWAGINPKSGPWRNKLYWLPQGADERIAGSGSVQESKSIPILMTGISRGGGRGREQFVIDLASRYEGRFHQVRSGLYREDLKAAIANTAVVVCPDSPITDRYWSNRVYNAAGFGAFILHPYSEGVLSQYHANSEVVYYHNRHDLYCAIDYFLGDQDRRTRTQNRALARTLAEHLYSHRCKRLLDVVT